MSSSLSTYDARRRKRLCVRCGDKAERGYVHCARHRQLVNAHSRESMRRKYARNIARYGRARGRR